MATEAQEAAIRTTLHEYDWATHAHDITDPDPSDPDGWLEDLAEKLSRAIGKTNAPTTLEASDLEVQQ